MRARLVILLLLAAPAAGSQEADPAAGAVVAAHDSIARCIETATGEELGLAELEEACPGLEHALTESGYVGFVGETEIEQLTTYSLADLRYFIERYRSSPEGETSPAHDVSQLASVLDALEAEQRTDRPPTLMERFKRWLNGLINRQQQEQDPWLVNWLRDLDISERIVRGIVYGSILLIIAIALGVIVNELRAAGVFRRRGRRLAAVPVESDGGLDLSHATLADLDRVAASDRPALLLRVLVNTLVNTGRLRAEKSLTHRELGTRAAFDAVDQRQSFNRVAALGERMLYGHRDVPADEVDAVIETGRALERQLNLPRTVT